MVTNNEETCETAAGKAGMMIFVHRKSLVFSICSSLRNETKFSMERFEV
jgi:hypothetical protein